MPKIWSPKILMGAIQMAGGAGILFSTNNSVVKFFAYLLIFMGVYTMRIFAFPSASPVSSINDGMAKKKRRKKKKKK